MKVDLPFNKKQAGSEVVKTFWHVADKFDFLVILCVVFRKLIVKEHWIYKHI